MEGGEEAPERGIDICQLNDDFLVHIFSYLPMIDRVRIQRGIFSFIDTNKTLLDILSYRNINLN